LSPVAATGEQIQNYGNKKDCRKTYSLHYALHLQQGTHAWQLPQHNIPHAGGVFKDLIQPGGKTTFKEAQILFTACPSRKPGYNCIRFAHVYAEVDS
jgi:hypothetical protein